MSGGRGAYYKNKYGGGGGRGGGGRNGGGRGGGRGGRGRSGDPVTKRIRVDDEGGYPRTVPVGGNFTDLAHLLRSIDGRNYGSYHDLEREWHHETFTLRVGRAQSDPFAPPTRCQIRIPASHFQRSWPDSVPHAGRVAASDFLLRHLYGACRSMGADQSLRSGGGGGGGWSGPKGGDLQILEPTQHVLEQSAVQIVPVAPDDEASRIVVLQMTINLPARGRTILGLAAQQIFCTILPQLVAALTVLPTEPIWKHVKSCMDQVWLQQQLAETGLVAFVPDGAILPRRSGVDDRPLLDAVPFTSPTSMQRTFVLPQTQQTISGMGIPDGVTLICGGGFHGKSTLLQALQWGIYPKVPGDGREFCVVRPRAMTIRAEDGRWIQAVNIADFLSNLPGNSKDTACFSTENASGSTSQASNIAEAVELGVEALLMDEDRCATNFLVRDAKMMQLVAAGKEPITPFVRRVRALYEQLSVSTILVIGGTGDYFDVADHVLVMDSYNCQDATGRAKDIVKNFGGSTDGDEASSSPLCMASARSRTITRPAQIQPNGKMKTSRTGLISYGDTEIDVTAVEQIVSASQTSAIAHFLKKVGVSGEESSLLEVLQSIDEVLDQHGLDALAPGQFHGGLTRPRLLEVGATLNRLRVPGTITQANK